MLDMICQKAGGQRLSAPEVPLVTCRLSSLAGSFSGHLGMNIKEHSGKRSCKKKKQINKISFIFFYSCCFQRTTPSSPNWTLDFEPAFSPRVSFPLSPRSFFQTRQRFPISNHVTSGSHEPAILFIHWSAVSHTGNDMTSSICSRPIRSQSECHTGPTYYSSS